MIVKILKSGSSEYWYNDYIGKIFEVNEELDNDFRLYDDKGFGKTIAKEDCVKISKADEIFLKNTRHKELKNGGDVFDALEMKHILDEVPNDIDFLLSELEKSNNLIQNILEITNIENDDYLKIHSNLLWIRGITSDFINDRR